MRTIALILMLGFVSSSVALARPACGPNGCRRSAQPAWALVVPAAKPAPVSSPEVASAERQRVRRCESERGPVLTFLGNCRQRMQDRVQNVRSFFGGRR